MHSCCRVGDKWINFLSHSRTQKGLNCCSFLGWNCFLPSVHSIYFLAGASSQETVLAEILMEELKVEIGGRKQLSKPAMWAWTCEGILEESKLSGAPLLCTCSLALS